MDDNGGMAQRLEDGWCGFSYSFKQNACFLGICFFRKLFLSMVVPAITQASAEIPLFCQFP
jgi:hypothetical protein